MSELRDQPEIWPVSDRTILGEGVVQTFLNDDVTTPTGETMRRQYTRHPGAVAILAWNDDDEVAVITQYRHPVGFKLVEIPAGILDHPGEDGLEAAKRELAEEAALEASDWRVLLDFFSSPGAGGESVRVYLARGLRSVPRPAGFVLEDEEADMKLFWVPRSELVDGIFELRFQSPSLVQGVLALETARLSGRLDSLASPSAPWPAREQKAKLDALLPGVAGTL